MSSDISTNQHGELGITGLVGVTVGITLATGVWSLSGDFAAKGAYPAAVIIGWIICGIGMFGLMNVFMGLSNVRPDLKGGIFSFAQAGFGDYVGFNSAWGYWCCCWLSQVAVCNLLFASLGNFMPNIFGMGNNGASLAFGSILIWFLCYICIRGIKEASIINVIVTIAKILPLLSFVILAILLRKFNLTYFLDNFWGDGSTGLSDQIKATSGITLWVFAGIESAVVVSTRAKRMQDVGRATAIAFFFIFVLYMLITLISMGVIDHKTLASLSNPSLAGLMEYVVGPWGKWFINIGVIISTIGCLLAVTIVTAEVANAAAKRGSFLKFFEKENKKGAPSNALIVSTLMTQIFLIVTYFNESTYQIFYIISASMLMLPYLLSAAFYWKVVSKGEGFEAYANTKLKMRIQLLIATIGVIYSAWLVYAAGLTGLLITTLLYAPGTLIYVWGKKERKEKSFAHWYDLALLALILICGVTSLFLILTGKITPFS